ETVEVMIRAILETVEVMIRAILETVEVMIRAILETVEVMIRAILETVKVLKSLQVQLRFPNPLGSQVYLWWGLRVRAF
ncbi:MAG: hypothetical protein SVX43_19410, partial [Cyanobacteriota bacterium]|nr:hypothetical protein [Cyanobacteriota bacterium]